MVIGEAALKGGHSLVKFLRLRAGFEVLSMKNAEIIRIFSEIADILDIKGENPFKSRAYRRAAQSIRTLTKDVSELVAEGSLEEVVGVGKELATKVAEYVQTGKLSYYEKVKSQIPAGLLEIIRISGVGPKTAKLLNESLGVSSIEDLERELKKGSVAKLPGMGLKTQENIIKGLESYKKGRERSPLGAVWERAEALVAWLRHQEGVRDASAAGSYRRKRDTVKDLDLVASSHKPAKVIKGFLTHPDVKEVAAWGDTSAQVILNNGLSVDLRVVEPRSYGALLAHSTGSWAHNTSIRSLALKLGLKANEYGIFDEKTGDQLAGATEEDYYRALGLPWIPPELREDGSEVEAALAGALPRLVEVSDIVGDFHMHTTWSDGGQEILEVAQACQRLGYQYLAITDHSKSLPVGNGLNEERLLKQVEEIRRISEKLKGITILAGSEVDILADGSMDFDDDILKELDFVIGSVHSNFRLDKKTQTRRIIQAMENPYVHLIGHISGRLMPEREAYELDYEEIFAAARDTNTHIEINAYPFRLDLTDLNCRRAKELKVPLAIASDAHHVDDLGQMAFGVATARRGWLTRDEVLNSKALEEMLAAIKKR